MDQDKIISHFHEKDKVPSDLKESKEFKETEKIFKVRKMVSFLNKAADEDILWGRISQKINPERPYSVWIKYAAIIILSFAVGSLLIYFSGFSNYDNQLASVTSPRGQITHLTLFDGSTVWLNSETTIEYSTSFNKKKREVKIEGEAYFQVAHDKRRPFLVHAGNSQIKVHGTSFNVKAYAGSDKIEAALEEGKIEFITNNQSTILKPSEQVTLIPSSGEVIKNVVEVEKKVAWKKGKYYYNNEKLSAILEQLQRWYGVDLVFDEGQLSQYQFTGVINRQKSINYNLKLIELTNRVLIEFNDERIIIQGR